MTKDILVITHNAMPFHGIQDRFISEKINIYFVDSIEEAVWKIQMFGYIRYSFFRYNRDG